MSLSGRLALVTGGSSGIGEAVCRTLAARGATVVVASRRIEAAQKVAQSLPGGTRHCGMHVDVGETSSVEELFSNIRAMFPQPLNIVVNSAAIPGIKPITECADDLFDEVIRVNLKGAFGVTRAASREMLRSGKTLPDGGGAIVNVTSISASQPPAGSGPYSAAKAGVEALTKVAAKETAAYGIRCNILAPGLTQTPMLAAVGEDRVSKAISLMPLKRVANPQEIAEAVVFLCSPTTSSYITCASLTVSGGL